MGRVLACITDDTCGQHDCVAGASTRSSDARKYGANPTRRNSRENFILAAAKHGRERIRDGGSLVFTRLRYFDPVRRRAGLPQDLAALVDGWGPDSLSITLVNISPSVAHSVIVQGGAYGEHQIVSVSDGKATMDVNAASFPVRMAPGAGAKLTIRMKRFANDPTLSFPWEDTVADLGSPPNIPPYVHKTSGVP